MSGWPPYDQAAPYYTHPYPPGAPYSYPVETRPAAPPAGPGPAAGPGPWTTAPPMNAYDDDDDPDVIIIKNRAKCYALQFRPFAIGDGLLTVGDVRDAAADKLGVSPARRVKLLYKGRLLKEDNVRAKAVGLKQNSQVLCVVSEDFGPDGSSSELSGGGGNGGGGGGGGEEELAVPVYTTTEGSRGRRRAYSRRSGTVHDDEARRIRDPELLAEPTTRQRRTRSPSSPPPEPRRPNLSVPIDRRPSRSSASSPRRHSPIDDRRAAPTGGGTRGRAQSADMRPRRPRASPSLSAPSPNLNSASGPREKVDLLDNYFSTVIVPSCREFIENPPPDAKERDFEHRRLSETTMTQLILKADEIDIDGDDAARQGRKSLIDRVHRLLKDVDDASNR